MASPGNQQCAICIGTLSFHISASKQAQTDERDRLDGTSRAADSAERWKDGNQASRTDVAITSPWENNNRRFGDGCRWRINGLGRALWCHVIIGCRSWPVNRGQPADSGQSPSQSLEDYPRFPAELDLDWVNPWLTLLQQLHWLPIKHRTDFKIANITFRILFMLPNRLICVRPCMPVIPLVPSDSTTLIFPLFCLSAPHLALADTALQPLKSGTLSLYLTVPVPVLTPFLVTSRPTTASRPSTPLNPSPLAPQIRLLWTIVCVYKLYLLTLSWNVGLRQVFFENWQRRQRSASMMVLLLFTK